MKALVSISRCQSYEYREVHEAIRSALSALGGIQHFVQPGMKVLLKPNLLSPSDPDKAITTHPVFVQVVAEIVAEAGGEVWIGDSPGGTGENTPELWWKTGMTRTSEVTSARLVPFQAIVWKSLRGKSYLIARPVFEADLLINLPKLKTHTLTLYTGAVKNLFGVIPGTRKREIHLRAPSVREFSSALVNVLELVRPGLTIIDGIVGQEGNGPGANGTPRRYGVVAASTDPVALDVIMAKAMGCPEGGVLHLKEANRRELGVGELHSIKVEGDNRALEFGKVRLPPFSGLLQAAIPEFIAPLFSRPVYVRPKVNSSACTGCGLCAQSCPRQAITPDKPARINYRECVGCLCCAEICPQGAITPLRSPLARIAGIK
ncbi:MAG: DUF362 domain-containing protein [Coprothermobacterota bacterium]|nr:DUF362 domain-containing protein [Coprothermobacterota bacterium]